MADIPALLLSSLDQNTRKQAEHGLNELTLQPGFLPHLLRLIVQREQDPQVRLAGSVYLKNVVKLRWEEDVQPLPEADKAALREHIVPAMIALSEQAEKPIRAQVAESVALIAELDFPSKWPTLVDQLVASLSLTNYNVNIGVLQTAHSIFRHWRSLARSDALYSEINLVISKFLDPFLQLFRNSAEIILKTAQPHAELSSTAQSMVLMLDIYYDFTCHDLPPAIEDSHMEFFSAEGWLPSFMKWDPPALRVDPDELAPSLPSQVKTAILEICELFIKLYPEQLQQSSAVETVIQSVWTMMSSGGLTEISNDQLVSQALRFISTAIRSGYYKELFSSPETISSLVQGVVVPNVSLRDHDIEQFEDDPLEFIRLDLSISTTGTEAATRRQSAADVVQALVSSGFETETTQVVGTWIETGLREYNNNRSENWRAKDVAIYLLTAVATRGATIQSGVTSTNALVNVVDFFTTSIVPDLQASPESIHPILQVDAIRFLMTFRSQLVKEHLLAAMSLLLQHVASNNYVTSTYAAITITRILLLKRNNTYIFNHTDISDFAPGLLDSLLLKLGRAGTPEKVAENDHLMKCVMSVIVTARHSLKPVLPVVLTRLVAILQIISKNPSNPLFDQYTFESLAALIRFNAVEDTELLQTFETALFAPFTAILAQDIDQYIPYVFQVLAQLLDCHTQDVPITYRELLPHLFTPAIWQQKGSIPGLVKFLKAYLSRDALNMVQSDQIPLLLGIVQNRLVPSKVNDSWGFELLHSVVVHVPITALQPYIKAVVMTLLTRMHSSKTDKYVYLFARFFLFSAAIQANGLSPDYLIGTVEDIQSGLWQQILENFIVPQAPKMPHKERKLAMVGITKFLTGSEFMFQGGNVATWPLLLVALIKLFQEPQYLEHPKEETTNGGYTQIDFEEETAGYQAAYSKLVAADRPEPDPVAYVHDPQKFVGESLQNVSQAKGLNIRSMIPPSDAALVEAFIHSFTAAGYRF